MGQTLLSACKALMKMNGKEAINNVFMRFFVFNLKKFTVLFK